MNSYRLTNMVDVNQVPSSPLGFNPSLMPYQNWSVVGIRENLGFANYQALNTELDHRFSKGLFLQASYNFAKNLTDANSDVPNGLPSEVGDGTVLADRFNLANNRGNDYATRRHRFLLSGIYDLPVGKGRAFLSNSGKFLDGVLGGWQISTVTLVETGPWLTPSISPTEDQSGMNILGRGAQLGRIGSATGTFPIRRRTIGLTSTHSSPHPSARDASVMRALGFSKDRGPSRSRVAWGRTSWSSNA